MEFPQRNCTNTNVPQCCSKFGAGVELCYAHTVDSFVNNSSTYLVEFAQEVFGSGAADFVLFSVAGHVHRGK